ncbi:MAG: hypothetical protein HeimC3_12990 [Candidatus Heimdallarchaeota archaeon LC_3]|nr:MAG: hypothetical protein HeimC3_15960 [Candidatus Heimdallarchaeota archaeon LC_3]OLS26025.1 MAG: hypothetical protein HeimC3_12990 [Candidatus Heimdallarchaeota archaeon LC_3]
MDNKVNVELFKAFFKSKDSNSQIKLRKSYNNDFQHGIHQEISSSIKSILEYSNEEEWKNTFNESREENIQQRILSRFNNKEIHIKQTGILDRIEFKFIPNNKVFSETKFGSDFAIEINDTIESRKTYILIQSKLIRNRRVEELERIKLNKDNRTIKSIFPKEPEITQESKLDDFLRTHNDCKLYRLSQAKAMICKLIILISIAKITHLYPKIYLCGFKLKL